MKSGASMFLSEKCWLPQCDMELKQTYMRSQRLRPHMWAVTQGVSDGSLTKNGRKSQEGKWPGHELETIFTAQVHITTPPS